MYEYVRSKRSSKHQQTVKCSLFVSASLDVSHNGIIGEAAQELATVVLGKQSLEHFCEIPLKDAAC